MCYRRDDSADVAGRIYDRLAAHFGREAVYRDVDAIPIGVDFRDHIKNCLNRCRVGLVIMGRNWLNAALPDGTVRLQDPADHVRIEIEIMLSKDVLVVPVYVGGAETLRTSQLMESLQQLVYRNGVFIRRDPDFHRDMDRFLSGLETIFKRIEREERERDEATRRVQDERGRAEPPRVLKASPPAQQGLSLSDLFFDVAAKISGASLDLAVDLGSSNTVIYKRGYGICLREPSIVAIATKTGEVHAVGEEARRILADHSAGLARQSAIKGGVVTDVNIVAAMLTGFIAKVRGDAKGRPRLVIAVPGGTSQVEKDAAWEAGRRAGAREVFLIEQTMAAAIGVGFQPQEAAPCAIIDIGAGTTKTALISRSNTLFLRSLPVAGGKFDEAILRYIKRAYNLLIGDRTAEEIKIKIGSAYPGEKETSVEVKGRDLVAGSPKIITLTSQEVREAVLDEISAIVDLVNITLEHCPAELSSALSDRGMVLVGGGGLLRGLDTLISEETGLPIKLAEDAFTAVADGAGMCLDKFRFLREAAKNHYASRED